MAGQPFLEVEKAVITLTFGCFWRQHPSGQSEPKHEWSRDQYAVGENESPQHSFAKPDVDRPRRLDDLHGLVEQKNGEYNHYEGGND
jgi:hypothetical protein